MSDVNKIVAAILTAGRLPNADESGKNRNREDWLAEYEHWIATLNGRDDAAQSAATDEWLKGMGAAINDRNG